MSLDCIVVNYRTPHDLHWFLMSYSIIEKPPGRLFVYNVDPQEDDRTVVDWWRDELKLEVMESPSNCGYAHAVNAAVRHCDADAIAIFNADIEFSPKEPRALVRCHRELMAHDDWGVLGPRQIDRTGRITHAGILGERGEIHVYREWHARQEWLEDDDEDRIIDSVATVMGSAMFMRRACWEELATCPVYLAHLAEESFVRPYGAMLPTKLYYEETFMCYHAIEHGWKVVYYGPVTLIHEWHQSINKHVPQDKEFQIVEISKQQFDMACDAVHGMPHA